MSILFFALLIQTNKSQCRKAQPYKKKFIKQRINYKLKLKKGVLSNKNV